MPSTTGPITIDDNIPDVAPTADVADDLPVRPAAEVPGFRDLGVLDAIATALEAVGITAPFPIQSLTLPVALAGHDVIGQAKTGTGKTLGFGIPLLQRILAPTDPGFADLPGKGKPQALVVVPTRELCVQVTGDIDVAGRGRGVRVLSIYGGRSYEPQVETLRKGVEVVIGTPGRLIDLANQGHLDLGNVRILVLDEADEMLDLGFLPDVERIVRLTPAGRQTMLFSATMPGEIITLARSYMTQPTHIRAVDPDDDGATVKAIAQHVFRAHAMDKVEMLARLLQARGRGLTLVFCRTKRTAAKVADDLADRGFAAAAVHGDLGQGAREQALRAFRSGKVDVLVATDVAARGIDVEDITHVVNFQCPEDEKTYLHRIGRTGRAGKSGIAVAFVDWDDIPRWMLIDRALGLGFGEPEETYSTSEHFHEALNIPADVTGVLPRVQRVRAGLGAEVIEDLGETGRAAGAGARGRGRGDRPGRSERPGGSGRRMDRAAASSADDGAARGPETAPGADAGGDAAPARVRRQRTRQRTRSGRPLTDASAGHGAEGTVATSGERAATDAGEGAPRRRRRSPRGPRTPEQAVAD
jgi:superfamily II DNA/RNA helicase